MLSKEHQHLFSIGISPLNARPRKKCPASTFGKFVTSGTDEERDGQIVDICSNSACLYVSAGPHCLPSSAYCSRVSCLPYPRPAALQPKMSPHGTPWKPNTEHCEFGTHVYKTTCHFSIHCVRALNLTMATVKPARKNCAMGICHFHCWAFAFSIFIPSVLDIWRCPAICTESVSGKNAACVMAALAGANVRVARESLISIVCIHSTRIIRYHLIWMRFAVCCSVRRAHYSTSFSFCHLLSLHVFTTHFYTCISILPKPTLAQLFGPLLHIVRTQESVFGTAAASDWFSELKKKPKSFQCSSGARPRLFAMQILTMADRIRIQIIVKVVFSSS